MKEKYFTKENLPHKAEEIKKEAKLFYKHPEFEFTGKNSALLVIDMQNFFKEPASHAFIPSFETIIPNISSLINTFKKNSLPVIFTRHVNTPENAFMMGKWWKDILTEEDEYSVIIKDFDLSNHIIVKKPQYNAFYNTDLESILRSHKTNNLVITGVMAHLCCETTAREAFVRGFETYFVIDGTATYTEQFHRNTVMNLAHGFSAPVLTKEILNRFQ